METRTLDNYSLAIKQDEKTRKWINEKIADAYGYNVPHMKIDGTRIIFELKQSGGGTSSEDFIDKMKFSRDRLNNIKTFLLKEVQDQALEDYENARKEFNQSIIDLLK